jgi:hypothetical protein
MGGLPRTGELILSPVAESLSWSGAGGRNRTGTGLSPNGFSYPYGFHRRPLRAVCGLDYPFTLAPSRFRCCPSSLYTFPSAAFAAQGLARDCHLTGFPEFEQFYVADFPARTQASKSGASTSFATPALGSLYP